MSDEELILAHNARFAETYKDTVNKKPNPLKRLAIITCMDAWISMYDVFPIKLGDAHIIRNAGGCAREGLRSLILSQQLMETIEVRVVKHTRCGMEGTTNPAIRAVVKKNTGHSAEHIDFRPFEKVKQAVYDDMAWLQGNVFMKGKKITGWVIPLETGVLCQVEIPAVAV